VAVRVTFIMKTYLVVHAETTRKTNILPFGVCLTAYVLYS